MSILKSVMQIGAIIGAEQIATTAIRNIAPLASNATRITKIMHVVGEIAVVAMVGEAAGNYAGRLYDECAAFGNNIKKNMKKEEEKKDDDEDSDSGKTDEE